MDYVQPLLMEDFRMGSEGAAITEQMTGGMLSI